jgi:hypothetical protein
MPATTTSRSFTDAEKLELQSILRALPGRLGKAKLAISTALLLWIAWLAGAVVVWLIVAAVAKAALGLSFGWNSPYLNDGAGFQIGLDRRCGALAPFEPAVVLEYAHGGADNGGREDHGSTVR